MKQKKIYWIISFVLLLLFLVIVSPDFKEEVSETSFEEELSNYESIENRDIEEDLQLGLLLSNDNQEEKAKSIYLTILKKEPDNEMATHRLAIQAMDDGNLEESKKYFEKNIKTYPKQVSHYYYYALLFLVEDLDQAGLMMTKAYELSDEEYKQFYMSWINIIDSIKREKQIGYQNLLSNDELYIPQIIKNQIKDTVSSEKH